MVLDMGTHTLRHLPGQHLLVQLLAPGLEERARILPALVSAHSTPGTPSWLSRVPSWPSAAQSLWQQARAQTPADVLHAAMPGFSHCWAGTGLLSACGCIVPRKILGGPIRHGPPGRWGFSCCCAGYFGAPGAMDCPLVGAVPAGHVLPGVSIVFCSCANFAELKV